MQYLGQLFDGSAAEQQVKGMLDVIKSTSQDVESDLIRHNLVVFREGENALQVFPPLVGIIPEARLNLVIHYLHSGEFEEAYELIKGVIPNTPHDFILKAVANVALGQVVNSLEHLELAKNFFQTVGESESECDTIHGRQCMASKFILERNWDEVLLYLSSIQAYSYNDDAFHMNYAVALGSTGKFREAEDALLQVQNEAVRADYMYISWLARCFIMNDKPQDAWELYLKMEAQDSLNLLLLVANDCYRMGSFYYAAKAFDVLERLDPNPEYWDGKRSACCGVFQKVIGGLERKGRLRDVIQMLLTNTSTPQAELIVRTMQKWADENGLNVTGL